MNSGLFRGGFFSAWKQVRRQEFLRKKVMRVNANLENASKAQVLQRELVQKTLHQLYEYNDETHGSFLKPILESKNFLKSWSQNTSGLSAEEVADLEKARADLENYEKIYNIFEYATDLNRAMNIIETRICANNPSVPMNMYRISSSSSI